MGKERRRRMEGENNDLNGKQYDEAATTLCPHHINIIGNSMITLIMIIMPVTINDNDIRNYHCHNINNL